MRASPTIADIGRDWVALERRIAALERVQNSGTAPWVEVAPAGTGGGVVEFQNGWVPYAAGVQLPAYQIVGLRVWLRGTIKHNAWTPNLPMFTLPVAPEAQRPFIVLSNDKIGRINVNATSEVVPTVGDAVGGSVWFSLEAITFDFVPSD